MRSLREFTLPLVVMISLPAVATAQPSGRYFSLVDGRIQLNGSYENVDRIEIVSKGKFLSLDTKTIPLRKTEPFAAQDGIVVVSSLNEVVLGVLGRDKMLSMEGMTRTSILYSEPLETASAGDLTVLLGVADVSPLDLPVIAADAAGPGVTVVDGAITIMGDFSEVAGVQAESVGGFLSLDVDLDGPGEQLPLTAPFVEKRSTLLTRSSNEIDIRVLHPQFRFDIAGETPTSFLYSESDDIARQDLTMVIGLGSSGLVRVPYAVPEPAGESLAMLGLCVGCLGARRRRKVSFLATS